MIVCVRWLNNVFFSSSVPGSFDGELDRSALNNAVRHFLARKYRIYILPTLLMSTWALWPCLAHIIRTSTRPYQGRMVIRTAACLSSRDLLALEDIRDVNDTYTTLVAGPHRQPTEVALAMCLILLPFSPLQTFSA